MRFGSSLKITLAFVAASVLLLPTMLFAQQDQSVADAARKAREQKKTAPKAKKVITDDDLPAAKPGDVTVVGQGQADTPASAATNGAAEPAANAADTTKKAAEEDAEAAKLKAQVAQAEKELDLLQRAFTLDSDAYYSKTNYATDTAGKAKLDAEKQAISDKQQDLERLKTRLAAVQELQNRRKPAQSSTSNPPPAGEKPPTTQPNPPQS
jgi:DNA repair exonuclease SbcCD ATPase subunit